MDNHLRYVSVDRLFSKLYRDYDLKNRDIQEVDVIEWAGEALEAIGAVTQYEEAVAFIEVKNHQVELPCGLHSIIQVARNHCWHDKGDVCAVPEALIDPHTEDEGPYIPVPLDCNGTPITEYELAYYRPYYDLQYEFGEWRGNSLYNNCYRPVRLSQNTFFDSVVCKTEEENKHEHHPLYRPAHHRDEYSIINKDFLRFSFKKGFIAVAYTRQVLDENGFPMIPEHYSYMTAVSKYVGMKIFERDYYNNREGAGGKMQKLEQDWHWYCKQAGNYALIPKSIDDLQDIFEQRNYLLPRIGRYYGFFGKLNTPENQKFKDPDYRNFKNSFIGYRI